MRRKIILIFGGYLMILLIGLISCEEKNDCGPFPNRYKTIGLDWQNYRAYYSDTVETKLLLGTIDNDSVIFNEYSIYIAPRQVTFYANIVTDWDFNIVQSAYACSPVIPTTDERIDSVVVISQKDFDGNHKAGVNLSDLFDIVVLDNANGIYYTKYGLEDYLSTVPYVPNEMTLILKAKPALTTDFEFLVKYYQKGMENNDYFEFTTRNLVIKGNE